MAALIRAAVTLAFSLLSVAALAAGPETEARKPLIFNSKIDVPGYPAVVALDIDGSKTAFQLFESSAVFVVDLKEPNVFRRIATRPLIADLGFTLDSEFLVFQEAVPKTQQPPGIHLYSMSTGQQVASFHPDGNSCSLHEQRGFAFSQDGKSLYVGCKVNTSAGTYPLALQLSLPDLQVVRVFRSTPIIPGQRMSVQSQVFHVDGARVSSTTLVKSFREREHTLLRPAYSVHVRSTDLESGALRHPDFELAPAPDGAPNRLMVRLRVIKDLQLGLVTFVGLQGIARKLDNGRVVGEEVSNFETDRQLELYTLPTGKLLQRLAGKNELGGNLSDAASMGAGRQTVVSYSIYSPEGTPTGGGIAVFETDSGRKIQAVAMKRPASNLTISPDGNRVAVSTVGAIYLYSRQKQ